MKARNSELYKGYMLISGAMYNSDTKSWVPSVNISWTDGEMSHFHSFRGPSDLCHTEEFAVVHGLVLGRAWVDKEL